MIRIRHICLLWAILGTGRRRPVSDAGKGLLGKTDPDYKIEPLFPGRFSYTGLNFPKEAQLWYIRGSAVFPERASGIMSVGHHNYCTGDNVMGQVRPTSCAPGTGDSAANY